MIFFSRVSANAFFLAAFSCVSAIFCWVFFSSFFVGFVFFWVCFSAWGVFNFFFPRVSAIFFLFFFFGVARIIFRAKPSRAENSRPGARQRWRVLGVNPGFGFPAGGGGAVAAAAGPSSASLRFVLLGCVVRVRNNS